LEPEVGNQCGIHSSLNRERRHGGDENGSSGNESGRELHDCFSCSAKDNTRKMNECESSVVLYDRRKRFGEQEKELLPTQSVKEKVIRGEGKERGMGKVNLERLQFMYLSWIYVASANHRASEDSLLL
jgi:hypothetical protein